MYFLVIINKLYIKYECAENNKKRGLWDSYTYYMGSDKEAEKY
jgi:hypothetical protein